MKRREFIALLGRDGLFHCSRACIGAGAVNL